MTGSAGSRQCISLHRSALRLAYIYGSVVGRERHAAPLEDGEHLLRFESDTGIWLP